MGLRAGCAAMRCIRADVFCDSNILLYAASNAPEDVLRLLEAAY